MIDVFTKEIEVIIKDGIANLYWHRDDFRKVWLRSGVKVALCDALFSKRDARGKPYTRRQLMDLLYERLRMDDADRSDDVSRNFTRILLEHRRFTPQDRRHRVEISERSALQLRAIIAERQMLRESMEPVQLRIYETPRDRYRKQLSKLRARFVDAISFSGAERGYAFETLVSDLMDISAVPIEEPFQLTGEQIEGAIRYGGHRYLVALSWDDRECDQADVASLYHRVNRHRMDRRRMDRDMDVRGVFISMGGYTTEVPDSLSGTRENNVVLLDGVHLFNVFYDAYVFQELMEHALNYALSKGEIYCPTNITH